MESRRIASQDPKPGSISSLRCHRSRTHVPKDAACEVMFSRTLFVPIGSGQSLYSARLYTQPVFIFSRSSLYRATTRQPSLRLARRAVAGAASDGWWSQTGSNRRPHACKARALPAELWPRTRRRMLHVANALRWIRDACARSKWWAWEDLNFRPHAYQARALTN